MGGGDGWKRRGWEMGGHMMAIACTLLDKNILANRYSNVIK